MMQPKAFADTLRSFVRKTPFQPFVIEMAEGRQAVIRRPDKLAFSEGGGASYLTAEELYLIDCENVIQIRPLEAQKTSP